MVATVAKNDTVPVLQKQTQENTSAKSSEKSKFQDALDKLENSLNAQKAGPGEEVPQLLEKTESLPGDIASDNVLFLFLSGMMTQFSPDESQQQNGEETEPMVPATGQIAGQPALLQANGAQEQAAVVEELPNRVEEQKTGSQPAEMSLNPVTSQKPAGEEKEPEAKALSDPSEADDSVQNRGKEKDAAADTAGDVVQAAVTGKESPAADRIQRTAESAEAPAQADTVQKNAPEEEITLDRLPAKIVSEFSGGNTKLEVSLEPRELGKLVISASFREGKAVVSLICSNPKTAELLSARSGELGGIMEANLGSRTEVVIEQDAQGKAGSEDMTQEQGNGGGYREDSSQKKQKDRTDSFWQQLRLGLA